MIWLSIDAEWGRYRYANPFIQSVPCFNLWQFGHILLGVPYHMSASGNKAVLMQAFFFIQTGLATEILEPKKESLLWEWKQFVLKLAPFNYCCTKGGEVPNMLTLFLFIIIIIIIIITIIFFYFPLFFRFFPFWHHVISNFVRASA